MHLEGKFWKIEQHQTWVEIPLAMLGLKAMLRRFGRWNLWYFCKEMRTCIRSNPCSTLKGSAKQFLHCGPRCRIHRHSVPSVLASKDKSPFKAFLRRPLSRQHWVCLFSLVAVTDFVGHKGCCTKGQGNQADEEAICEAHILVLKWTCDQLAFWEILRPEEFLRRLIHYHKLWSCEAAWGPGSDWLLGPLGLKCWQRWSNLQTSSSSGDQARTYCKIPRPVHSRESFQTDLAWLQHNHWQPQPLTTMLGPALS